MTAITSAANGNWSAPATWTGGVVPTIADTVTVTHQIVMDGNCDCLSMVVNSPGRLTASQTVSSALRYNGNVTFNTGTRLVADLSAFPSLTYENVSTQGGSVVNANSRLRILSGASIVMKGAYRKRVTKAQGTIASGASGMRSFVVDDATGWAVGDKLILVTTAPYVLSSTRNSYLVIASISGGPLNATITVDLGVGSIAVSSLDRAYVGNYSSNVRHRPFTSALTSAVYVNIAGTNGIPNEIRDVAFDFTNGTYSGEGYGLTTNQGYTTLNGFDGGGIFNNAFYLMPAFGNAAFSQTTSYTPIAKEDNLVVGNTVATGSMYWLQSSDISNQYRSGPDVRTAVFGGSGLYHLGSPMNGEAIDCIVGGPSSVNFASSFTGFGNKYTGCKFFSARRIASGNAIGSSFKNCEFESEYPGLTQGSDTFLFAPGMYSDLVFEDCKFPSDMGATNKVITSNADFYTKGNRAYFKNKNGDPDQQEAYTTISNPMPTVFGPTFKRDKTLAKRGDASTKILAKGTTYEVSHFSYFVAQPNKEYLVKGFIQYTSAAMDSVPPRVFVTGAGVVATGVGVSGNTFTTPVGANVWQPFDITISHSGATATTVTLEYAVRTTTTDAAYAYFSGVYDYPWVQRARHYGYLFLDQPYQTLNPVTVATEAVALAYTGVAINSVTPQITVSAGTANTFQKVYDYIQAWACVNIDKDVLLTSSDGNNFSMPLTCKLSWPAMGNDGTLIGGWLLLATPGVLNYKLSGTKIEFQTEGTYDMGGTVFSGTVELVNTSGGLITVRLPEGTSYTPDGVALTEFGITVESPVTTTTIAANVSLIGAEIRIYDLDGNPVGSLGSEIDGTESCPSSTFSFITSAGNEVWVQIMLDGYKEFGQVLVGPSASTTFTFALTREADA